uniref:Uncharacterized protein n=1 Tax=Leersia perrieri TaxID=77586 RepID=A0A0D9WLY3_9ORYZ
MASPPSPLESITRLLAELACRPRLLPGGGRSGDSLAAPVSSLAAAINPRGSGGGGASGTRVVDAVDRARVECLVRTTVSALSASVLCRVDRSDGVEMLSVGSSVAPGDCRELVSSCAGILEKLGGSDGEHSYDLLYAVVKTTLLSPRYQCLFPLPYYREDEDSTCDMGTISSVLTRHPTNQVLPSDYSIPLRGLGAILELHTAVVSSVLDVLFEPMAWGISMELGQKFPFSSGYFPRQHADLLAILTGPLSCRRFLDLTSYIDSTGTTIHSPWSSDGYLSEALSMEIISESVRDVSLAHRAAFYLSWVLCPSNEDQRQILAGNILELSHSWARNNKKRPGYVHHTSTVNNRRKLQIPTVGDTEKLHMSTKPVSSLIKEFDDRCVKFCSITANSQVQAEKLSDFIPICSNFLYFWILLGILLVSSSFLDDQDCDMLLHYTSTGQVLLSNETQRKVKDHVSNDQFSASCKGYTERWASAGASLIFGWLDLIVNMSAVIFECEDICDRFVSQLKSKTSPYLLKCVHSLLEVLDEANHRDFLVDLHDRLLNWNRKGQSFDGFEALEDIILHMNKKFHFRVPANLKADGLQHVFLASEKPNQESICIQPVNCHQ